MKYNVNFYFSLLIIVFSNQLLRAQDNQIGYNICNYINSERLTNIIRVANLDRYPIILLDSPKGLEHNAITELIEILTINNQPRWSIEISNSLDIKRYISRHLLPLSDITIMHIDQSLLQNSWLISFIVLLILTFFFYILFRYNQHQKDIQKQLKQEIEERTLTLTNVINNLKISQTEILDQYEQLKQQNKDINLQKNTIYDTSKLLEQQNNEKLTYFTNVAHELKTPLTLISSSTRKLIKRTKSFEAKKNIEIINRNVNYLFSMVNQIINLQKIDTKNIKLHPTRFNLIGLLDQTASDFSNLMQHRDIQLEIKYRIPHTHIVSDSEKIHMILFNLLSNAVKHTPNKGKITFHACQFTDRVTGKWIQYLSVTNSGSRIEKDEIEKIFNRFYQIPDQEKYTQLDQFNTGIGLHIVKELITILKGNISVKSPNKNSVSFRFYFPVSLSDNIEITPIPELETPQHLYDKIPTFIPIDQEKPTLLIVEDNYDMRNYIKNLLSDRFNVAEASNGENGYDIARNILPDFIISDLMMPYCDGANFCNKIRENSDLCHIPFLMLTANSDDKAYIRSYKNGVDGYITKPFKESILIAKVDAIMKNRKLNQKMFIDKDKNIAVPDLGQSDKQFMKKVMEVIEKNFSNPNFGVKELIFQINMSYSVIYKNFISLTGIPPVQFLLLYRLEVAKKILKQNRNNNVTVSQIAYKVGFNDPKYFTRCFVKEYNMTPSSIIYMKHWDH